MPMLVSTPEDWFRTRQKDFYLLRYQVEPRSHSEKAHKAWQKKYQGDQTVLFAWFEQNLPTVHLDIYGASEYSGWITGGPCAHGVDLDESAVAIFRAAWDKTDSPWQLELQSFDKWSRQIDSCCLLPIPLAIQQNIRWWDMPGGIVLLSKRDDGQRLSRWDAWWRLVQLIPALAETHIDSFPNGEYWIDEKYGDAIVIDYGDMKNYAWNGDDYQQDTSRITKLRVALGIPVDKSVQVVVEG